LANCLQSYSPNSGKIAENHDASQELSIWRS
jgi:hypothetical protein